ncbi:DUF2935 domain-containing protein [Tumebacillus sp. ITR2]|uniref:DUF2935 domain-containing protein n=1 Tax=Tumebacillus amylolyticus TaxID=2801339 RepID=A0ABS1J5Y5_9BACL|nr:DUF2935 domain-containing protein [Tumebacillus amylolyticus]MBL0385692.1 DUF2935 domain-containing protein [Tumebacillus amylolyticus]
MHLTYGTKMPMRLLDEVEFWKRQENEHTVVIATLSPDLEPQFKEALKHWGEAFAQVDGLATRYLETIVRSGDHVSEYNRKCVIHLVDFALHQSQHFIQFLHVLKSTSKAPSLNNPVVVTVLDHIRRESEYFIGASEGVLHKK